MSDAGGSSFSSLTDDFNQRVLELRQCIYLRVEETSKEIFAKDLQGLETSVRALEHHLEELRQLIQKEIAVVPKVKAFVAACALQHDHLQAINANLPARLPQGPSGTFTGHGNGRQNVKKDAEPQGNFGGRENVPAVGELSKQKMSDAAQGGERKKREPAPRWYVSQSELSSAPSYMRGRLTLDKVNICVDELAGHADNNARLMAAVKAHQINRLTTEERKVAASLYHAVAMRDGIRGRHWVLEADLKNGAQLKHDKSGKSMLTLLRHLGRVQEIRVSVDGTTTVVYTLQAQ